MRLLLALIVSTVPALAEAQPFRGTGHWEMRSSGMGGMRQIPRRGWHAVPVRSFRYGLPSSSRSAGWRSYRYAVPRHDGMRVYRTPAPSSFSRAGMYRSAPPRGFRHTGMRFDRSPAARSRYAAMRPIAYADPRAFRYAPRRSERYAQVRRMRQAAARAFPRGEAGARSRQGGAVVIGDSIADGVRRACRCGGRTRNGASPRTVLGYVRSVGGLSGRTVILSSGASNGPRDLSSVEAQVAHLRRSGARVALLGVGPRFGRLNPQLAAIAARHGARFMPIGRTRDGVHPRSYAGIAGRGR